MFSIIIPTYNRRKKILNCLDSLNAQMDKNFMVYIVNDSGIAIDYIDKDKYKFRITLIEDGRHLGPGHCRNAALKKINTRYTVFLDDDCYPEPDWAHRINLNISKNSLNIIKGKQVFKKDYMLSLYESAQIWGLNTTKDFCSTSNVIIKTKLAKKTLFDTRFVFSYEDVDFFKRIGKKIVYSPDIVVRHDRRNDIIRLIETSFLSGRGKAVYNMKYRVELVDRKKKIFKIFKKYSRQIRRYLVILNQFKNRRFYILSFFILIDIIKTISGKAGFFYEKYKVHFFST